MSRTCSPCFSRSQDAKSTEADVEVLAGKAVVCQLLGAVVRRAASSPMETVRDSVFTVAWQEVPPTPQSSNEL